MAIQKTEAIVLKTSPFRETSLIVSLFTRDFGKFNGLIKGIRKTPQRYGGLPLICSHNTIVFYESLKKELNLVTQCDAKEQFLPIRQDLDKYNYANYFIELLDTVTQSYDRNEQLFELIADFLKLLSTHRQNQQIARIFEIKLLNLSGFKPRLDACVHCQRRIVQGRFSSILGGLLCLHCFNFDRSARPLFRGTLASIEYIERTNWQRALRLKMAASTGRELYSILSSFLDIHLGKEIKSRKLLI